MEQYIDTFIDRPVIEEPKSVRNYLLYLEKHIRSKNMTMWEAHQLYISREVAKDCYKVTEEQLKQLDRILMGMKPACFNPEKDMAYPLCEGAGKEECNKCSLYKDLEDDEQEDIS